MSTALNQYVAIALARQLEDEVRRDRGHEPASLAVAASVTCAAPGDALAAPHLGCRRG